MAGLSAESQGTPDPPKYRFSSSSTSTWVYIPTPLPTEKFLKEALAITVSLQREAIQLMQLSGME
jgi:hypothetical protein